MPPPNAINFRDATPPPSTHQPRSPSPEPHKTLQPIVVRKRDDAPAHSASDASADRIVRDLLGPERSTQHNIPTPVTDMARALAARAPQTAPAPTITAGTGPLAKITTLDMNLMGLGVVLAVMLGALLCCTCDRKRRNTKPSVPPAPKPPVQLPRAAYLAVPAIDPELPPQAPPPPQQSQRQRAAAPTTYMSGALGSSSSEQNARAHRRGYNAPAPNRNDNTQAPAQAVIRKHKAPANAPTHLPNGNAPTSAQPINRGYSVAPRRNDEAGATGPTYGAPTYGARAPRPPYGGPAANRAYEPVPKRKPAPRGYNPAPGAPGEEVELSNLAPWPLR